MRAPFVKAEQHGSIGIDDLTKIVMTGSRLGLAKERLVPFERAPNVAYADDCPGPFHCRSPVALTKHKLSHGSGKKPATVPGSALGWAFKRTTPFEPLAAARGQAFSSLFRRKARRLGSRLTHGSLSSVQIAASGGKRSGSSSDATVTSIHSESTSSWINRGVPQQEANERNRSAYKTLRNSPVRTSNALLGTLHQVTYGAALARRQSSQWQSLPCFGLTFRR